MRDHCTKGRPYILVISTAIQCFRDIVTLHSNLHDLITSTKQPNEFRNPRHLITE